MNDGWLPLPMPLAQFGGAVNAIRKQRTDAGLSLDGFQIIYAPAEPVTPGLIEGVDKLGLDQLLVICPWIQSPWDVEKWMRDGDDPSKLDSKKRAMENYAERVIRKFG
jgi:hypothetical protein